MSVKDMMSNWLRHNNSRLVKKQTSIRLPVHTAAKIEALCEMFPSKTKNEIVTDLLSAALDDVYESFEFVAGEEILIKDEEHYLDIGDRKTFIDLVNKHFQTLEKELGNSNPSLLYLEEVAYPVAYVDEMLFKGKKP